jgi:hypothetical protein
MSNWPLTKLVQEALGVLVAEDADARGQVPANSSFSFVHHQALTVLVADAFHQAVLQRVAEGAVAHIVQQDRDARAQGFFLRDGVALATQAFDGQAHEVHGAQRMVEARVQRAGIHQMREPELLDVAQALEPRMVDEAQQQRVRHGDETVDGVVEDLGGHGLRVFHHRGTLRLRSGGTETRRFVSTGLDAEARRRGNAEKCNW